MKLYLERQSPLQNKTKYLVTWDVEKAEILSEFFFSVFTRKCSSHTIKAAEGKGSNWENGELPTVGENKVLEYLRTPEVHKPLRSDEMHPWVLRKLVIEFAKPLSIILRCGGLVKFQMREKGKYNLIFKIRDKKEALRNNRSVSLTLVQARSWSRSSWNLY